jgi:hypothetical protein
VALAAAIPALRAYPLRARATAAGNDNLFIIFQNPPVTAKPFVRWWWNGNKLTATEILRELDVLCSAGIGGVEINPIAFPGGDDLAIPSMEWLSAEWIDMVKVALHGAKERGMVCDIIVGSGWPFGAEFLAPNERSQLLSAGGRKVSGAGTLSISRADLLAQAAPDIGFKYEGATTELHALYLAPLQMEHFAPPQRLPFDAAQDALMFNIPEGEHILYALVRVTGFQAVINGAPGAAGPVLNHFRQDAVEKFLARMSDRLFPALADTERFRALFCDSMELEGANWCPDFPAEFQRRRGYDICPYLPFVLYRVGHMGHAIDGTDVTLLSGEAKEVVARVRHDFFVTCMDIIRDRFLIPYSRWCRQHGFQSRVQAYGREFHPLEASLAVDIPECETWLWSNDGGRDHDLSRRPAYANVNKFVASAAHYAGRRTVSCEESTNTDAVFNATLERLKLTGDQSNLSGVTHSILHGFNYSPPEAPFPGWIRYGMFLNERNPWWPFFKLWTAYKARISSVLQASDAFADIAVMHPLADMWSLYSPQRDPFPERHYPEYQYRVWEGIHHNGNACDYISESIIQQSAAEDGMLRYGDRQYHTLMLLEVESMAPATATALARFVERGGRLLFVGKAPCKSTGFRNYRRNDRAVAQTIARIQRSHPSRVLTTDTPSDGDAVAWFGRIQRQCGIEPYMRIDRPNAYVSQIRHRTAEKNIFFISNCSTDATFSLRCAFPGVAGTPWLWDAETGARHRLPLAADGTLPVELSPAASQLLVFDENTAVADATQEPPLGAVIATLNNWKLRMKHLNGTVRETDVPALFDLASDERTRAFAGRLYYETTFDDTAAEPAQWLDLGRVYGVSEVSIDGVQLGCRWYGRHRYRLPERTARQRRTVCVTVTTTVGNYFKENPANAVGHAWTQHQAWQPVGMVGPVTVNT